MTFLDSLLDVRCLGCRQWGTALCDRCVDRISGKSVYWVHGGIRYTALGEYRGNLRSVILAIKHGRHRAVLRRLSTAIAVAATHYGDCVAIPVPSSNSGLRRRGFSLAAMIASHTGLTVRRAVSLADSSTQIGLSAQNRRRRRAMSFVGNRDLVGRRVLIVDDVCATGTTIRAAIDVCHTHGMTVCGVLVLAVSGLSATHGETLHISRTRVYG